MVKVVEVKRISKESLKAAVTSEGLTVTSIADVVACLYRKHDRHFPLPPRKDLVGRVYLEPSKRGYVMQSTPSEAETCKRIASQLETYGYAPINLIVDDQTYN